MQTKQGLALAFVLPLLASCSGRVEAMAPQPPRTGAEVKGVLVSEDDAPIKGRQVLLCKAKTTDDGKSALELSAETLKSFNVETDTEGRFVFKNVPPGTWGILSQMSELTSADGKGLIRIKVQSPTDKFDLGRIPVKRK